MSLLDVLLPQSTPEPAEARVVFLLDRHETEEERRKRRYEITQKWRSRNRAKRNANDRASRARMVGRANS